MLPAGMVTCATAARRRARSGCWCPRPVCWPRVIVPAEPVDDVLGDGQAEAGAGPARREVRIEDARQVVGPMPTPRSRIDDGHAAIGEPRRRQRHGGAVQRRRRRRRSRRRRPACALVKQVDQHRAELLAVGLEGRHRRVEFDRHRRVRLRRGDGADRVAAQRVDVGRRPVEAHRPGEVEHLVDDAIETLDLAVDVGGRFADVAGGRALARELAQRALDDHQRIADLVRDDRRHAAERGQALALGGLALKPRDGVGQVLKVVASSRASSSCQLREPVSCSLRVRSPVAATCRM